MTTFRKTLAAAFLLFTWLPSFSQDQTETKTQFETTFKTNEDKEDLIRLRDFLDGKDLEYDNLRSKLDGELKEVTISDSAFLTEYIRQLHSFLEKHKDAGDPFEAADLTNNIKQICIYANTVEKDTLTGKKPNSYNVNMALDNIEYWQNLTHQKAIVLKNLENVSKDRDAAVKAIQRIYNVEKGDQEYKTTISLYYAIIIFVLILISFYFLFRKSTPNIGNDFLNGNGLQFIALFAIIISTILFGILGILEGKELAAILSGIAGFILGRGLNAKGKPGDDDNSKAPVGQ